MRRGIEGRFPVTDMIGDRSCRWSFQFVILPLLHGPSPPHLNSSRRVWMEQRDPAGQSRKKNYRFRKRSSPSSLGQNGDESSSSQEALDNLRESSYNFTTKPIPSRSFFSIPFDIEQKLEASGNGSKSCETVFVYQTRRR